MNEPPQDVLLDSSAYFRLAQSIRPLLLMLTAGRIDMDKAVEILEYWDYENDLPLPKEKLRKVFEEYFGADCPI
jgi:hypothetical protein